MNEEAFPKQPTQDEEPKKLNAGLEHLLEAHIQGSDLTDPYAQQRQEIRQRTEQAAYNDLVSERRELILESQTLDPDNPVDRQRLEAIEERQRTISVDLADFPDAQHPD